MKVGHRLATLFPRIDNHTETVPVKAQLTGKLNGTPNHLAPDGGIDEGVELVDEQGYALIRSMIRLIPDLLEEPENYDARAEYAWAGSLAHNSSLSDIGIFLISVAQFIYHVSLSFL